MDKCILCKNRPADRKGSHIISLAVLKSLVADGENDARGNEVTFSLSSKLTNSFYFGRDLSPEKIREIIGRDLTDEELAKNKNQFTQDFIFCNRCEKRFSYLESLFAEKHLKKIEEFQVSDADTLEVEKDTELFFPFFVSLVWRMGATKFGEFNLESSIAENLRILLDKCLTDSADALPNQIKENRNEILRRPFLFGIVENKGNGSANIVCCQPINQSPYGLIINEFVLFFYNKKKSLSHPPQKFFGLENLVKKETISSKKYGLRFVRVSIDSYGHAGAAVLNQVIIGNKKIARYLFVETHKKMLGTIPSENMIEKCLSSVWNQETDYLGTMDTDRVIERMAQFMEKHCR